MSAWQPTEFMRRLGKYELCAWRIDYATNGMFWLSVVRHAKTRDVPIKDMNVYDNPAAARKAAVKTYQRIKRRSTK